MSRYLLGLRCRVCDARYPAGVRSICDECFGPVEPHYDEERLAADVDRAAIEAGPPSLWRYEAFLPAVRNPDVDLGDGWSPLRHARRLGAELGLPRLHLKDETRNPTHSFKDRVVSVALTKALEFGYRTVGCASTGNLANAVAAHAAAAGLRAVTLVPQGLEPAKLTASAVYGATLVEVDGTYDDVQRLCSEADEELETWAFVNVGLRPYYAEGSKTIALETAEQLGWRAPDHVVVPVASGALLTRVAEGFRQLARVGLIDQHDVRVSGAQPQGCSPVATAFLEGVDEVRPVRYPDTIARSLAIGSPADGHFALEEVRRSNGALAVVSDDEIVEAVGLLARTEGIFAETAGGVTIATLQRLAARGVVRPDETVVAYVTGMGLKTLDGFGTRFGLEATIGPKLEALLEAVPA
ncbi:MAG TPA: threonine synthase [Actinomycetota bacterium]|nr:threonine synthase [Actinomycetota bacterium]